MAGRVSLKRKLYLVLEAGRTHDMASRVFDGAMATLILANVVAFSLGTVPKIEARHGPALELFNVVSVIIFTIEYIARLWVCTEHPPLKGSPAWRVRLGFAKTPYMLIDLAAIAPFYIGALLGLDLRVLRIFRLIRFFKLARFSPAFNTILRVFGREAPALFGVAVAMFGMLIVSASLLYLIEGDVQPEAFGSVPQAMWWAIATLTTVGYGDVTPITALGRIVAGFVMIFGLALFALPIGIIATAFQQDFQRRDFIVSWGMAARTPIFSDLSGRDIVDLLEVLQAQVARPGAVIAGAGEGPGALFVLLTGEAELHEGEARAEVSEGAYWGAESLLSGTQTQTAVAVSNCDLLVLSRDDFLDLSRRHPGIYAHILRKIKTSSEEHGGLEEE